MCVREREIERETKQQEGKRTRAAKEMKRKGYETEKTAKEMGATDSSSRRIRKKRRDVPIF